MARRPSNITAQDNGSLTKEAIMDLPTLAAWIEDMYFDLAGNEPCGKCSGSGIYYFGGVVENGVYRGSTGVCFACVGKGFQTPADQARNEAYLARVLRADFDAPALNDAQRAQLAREEADHRVRHGCDGCEEGFTFA